MKFLETRPASDEICVMSWSPKMDLIALGTAKGDVLLHRLSWQKVWQIRLFDGSKEEEPSTISIVTWHPDGIFICVVAGKTAYIVDVECGKIVHNYESASLITAVKWCPTDYELSMGEVLANQARQQSDFLRNQLKIQKLESFLSALVIGTEDGQIQVLTGGFLFALVLKIPSDSNKCKVMHVDATRNLQMFQFLVNQVDDSGSYLCLSHFKTDHFKKVSAVIGPLGFKYLFFIKNWSVIQSEITNLNDQWGKLVDIYQIYMTYASDKELPEVRADYMELLFTGISTVELEFFLGKVGREKEIKKHTNTVNSIYGAIIEHLRGIKCAIVFLLMELNEIGGFLRLSRVNEAEHIVADLRKSFTYLYIGALHIQSLVQNFVSVFLNFFHLLLNTIHLYNIQEVPDFIEEDADVNKILGFLDFQVDCSIFNFLLLNAADKFQDPPQSVESFNSVVTTKKGEKKDSQLPSTSERADPKWKSFPAFMLEYMDKHKDGFLGQKLTLDFPRDEVLKLFCSINLSRTPKDLIEKLLHIPALSTIPFSAVTYPLAMIPDLEGETREISGLRIKQNTVNSTSSMAYFNWDINTTYLFDFNFADNTPLVRSYSLNFSRKVVCCDLFSDNYLSVVTVSDSESKDEHSQGVIFQLNLEKIDEGNAGVQVDLSKFLNGSKRATQAIIPGDVTIDIPNNADLSKSILNHECPLLDSSTRIDGLVPFKMAVSGARKLGAILSESKRTIALIDMEQVSGENSYEDEGTAEFSSETLSEVSL